MAAATYSTNLSNIIVEFPNTTGWTAIGTGGAGLNAPETDYYIQGNNCITKNAFASSTKGMIYDSGSDQGGSGTDGAYVCWMTHTAPNSLAVRTSGGMQFIMGSSSSAYRHFYVGGSDTLTFQGWKFIAVSETATADTTTGSPTAGVEQTFGGLWNLPTGGPTKGAPNALDAIRFGRCDIIIEFGDATPNGPATFDGVLTNLETASNRYGMLAQREAGGAFENSGLLQFGSATNAVLFEDSDKTITLREHPHVTTNFNTWEVQNASSVVNLTRITVQALGTTSPGRWVTTDNATLGWDACSFIDMGVFGFNTNATIDGCLFLRCDQITHGGATMNNSSVVDPNVTANDSGLVYDVNADPDGEMDGMTFEMGTTATHAIEFGTNVPATMTLRNCTFVGYGTGNNANDSTFHFKDTAGSITLNLVNCSGNASYRTDGATITIVQDPVTTTVKAITTSGSNIQSARVFLQASSGTGPLPYQDSVSITQTGGTATVSHTAHGLSTNQYVVIRGANEEGYNKVAQITVTGANSYTYSVSSGLSSPATGSPTSTGVLVYGTTDVNGEVSDTRTLSTNQPVTGWVRKSTSSPLYKTSTLSGTVSNTAGATFTAVMISDE